MSARRFNAIQKIEDVWPFIEAVLLPLGFARTGNVFHRRSDTDLLPRLEGITLGLEYGCRTCWLHTTVKIPALIELLQSVRPFAYRKERAWTVPDHASHIACMLRLSEMPGTASMPLPEGIQWRDDGRLQRRRRVTAETLGVTLAALIEQHALPTFENRLTLGGLAAAADSPGYEASGIGGVWALAARLALGDSAGAERAFRAHSYSLGPDAARFTDAKKWLMGQGVEVGDVLWSREASEVSDPWQSRAWMNGELVR